MGKPRAGRGFTLIEVMITVALVGVLALLATVGYRRWTRSAYLSEAQDVVANIRGAEENFYAENGAYLNVSAGLGPTFTYPSPSPGAFKTQWGAACTPSQCATTNGWQKLAVDVGAPVIFGYAVIAGDGVKAATTLIGTPKVNGQLLDYSGMSTPARPWYFVQADANVSGDGASFMHVYGMSGTNRLFIDQEGN